MLDEKCVRLGKSCEYPAGRKPYGSPYSDKTPSASSSTSVSIAPSGNATASVFPDAFFLDPELFTSIPHSALKNTVPVPTEVSQLLGPDASLICEPYFASIDTWLPIISKKRLNQGLQAGGPSEASGLALLLLCMKLAIDNPQVNSHAGTESTLYRTARTYMNTLEESSPTSLHVFQSLVLIALYEIGHGIFPTAYLTVGRAARLGLLRGIHDRKNATQLFTTPQTWTYWEEERRTWWAVSILERLALALSSFINFSAHTKRRSDVSILDPQGFLLLLQSQLEVTYCQQPIQNGAEAI